MYIFVSIYVYLPICMCLGPKVVITYLEPVGLKTFGAVVAMSSAGYSPADAAVKVASEASTAASDAPWLGVHDLVSF